MVERGITENDVRRVLTIGVEIDGYPSDYPYPSRLLMAWCGARPIHVVTADNAVRNETIIVIVYEPDPERWEPGFEKRKTR
ncbi:MAG: DUF4258 domain-containing protein [Candidatus Binataceae bacterium]